MRQRCHLNLVCGTLGAGKTTLLRHLFTQKPADENWAVIVNEFGALGIDGAILQSQNAVHIEEIPGGCICCSALGELQDSLCKLLALQSFQRILIEPTGLSEVDTLVDLIRQISSNPELNGKVQLDNIICLMAANEIEPLNWSQNLSWQNLVNMADVLVFNKIDLCAQTHLQQLERLASDIYPPKQQILFTEQAQIEISAIDKRRNAQTKWYFQAKDKPAGYSSLQATTHNLTTRKIDLAMPFHPMLLEFHMQQVADTFSLGWRFDEKACFNWKALQELFNTLNANNDSFDPLRLKGVFRVGKPWMLFQWRSNQPSREIIAYRNDSRVEYLFTAENETIAQKQAFELYKKLLNCLKSA